MPRPMRALSDVPSATPPLPWAPHALGFLLFLAVDSSVRGFLLTG